MGIKLLDVAEMVKDKFYQEFTPRNAFFETEDFADDVMLVYSKMLDDAYKAEKARAKREEGFSAAEISPDWLITETLKIEKADGVPVAKTSQKIFSFSNDAMVDALAYMEPVSAKCNKLVKVSRHDLRAIELAPYTPVVYYFVKTMDTIRFANGHCIPEEVEVSYIPALDTQNEKCMLSENIVAAVIVSVLNLYYGIKSGMVIPKANDGNPNITMDTQQNDHLKK